jgi:hypothetical protein
LKIFPVLLGAGERRFGETSDKKPMRLVDPLTVGDGVAILTYEPVRNAERAPDRAKPSGQARGCSPPGRHPGERLEDSKRQEKRTTVFDARRAQPG